MSGGSVPIPKTPSYTEPNKTGAYGNAERFLSSITEGGILNDPYYQALKQQGLQNIGGQMLSGKQDINEKLASMGNLPAGVGLDALNKLRQSGVDASNKLNTDFLGADLTARQNAVSQAIGIQGLENQSAGMRNQFNLGTFDKGMSAYQADQQNSFGVGDVLGGLMGVGGQLGGAAISKGTCFCYAETFGNNSREYLKAREFSKLENDIVRNGYMKLSTLIIPVLRKSGMFKKYFKKFALRVLRGMNGKENISLKIMRLVCYALGKVTKLNTKEIELLNSIIK